MSPAQAPRLKRRKRKKSARSPSWSAVNDVADRHAIKVQAAIAGSLAVLRDGVDGEALQLALERNDPGMAIEAFPWDRWASALGQVVTPRLASCMAEAGEAVGRQTVVSKADFSLRGLFNMLNPRAARYAASQAARLVTRVTEATRWALRQVLADATARGESLRTQAPQLKAILVESAGLDAPRARRLETFRASLQGSGMTPEAVARRVAAKRDTFLMDRAHTIARHETQESAVAGQVEVWQQAKEAGLLPSTVMYEWIAAKQDPQERLCEICAGMDGQKVPDGQLFVSDYDGSTHARPPAHVQCRCALAIYDPEFELPSKEK